MQRFPGDALADVLEQATRFGTQKSHDVGHCRISLLRTAIGGQLAIIPRRRFPNNVHRALHRTQGSREYLRALWSPSSNMQMNLLSLMVFS